MVTKPINQILKLPIRTEAEFLRSFEGLLEATFDPEKRDVIEDFCSQIANPHARASLNTAVHWFCGMQDHLAHRRGAR